MAASISLEPGASARSVGWTLRQQCVLFNAALPGPDCERPAAQVLMYAQLRDNSQNLVKIVSGGVARSLDWRPHRIAHETPVSASIDGGGNFGMLVVERAVDVAAGKAAEHGVGIVGTNHTASGTGALGCAPQHGLPHPRPSRFPQASPQRSLLSVLGQVLRRGHHNPDSGWVDQPDPCGKVLRRTGSGRGSWRIAA